MRWRHYNLNAIFSTGLEIPSCFHYLSVESIMLQATLQTGVVKYVLTFHILTLEINKGLLNLQLYIEYQGPKHSR